MKTTINIFFFFLTTSLFTQSTYISKLDLACKDIKEEVQNSSIRKKHKVVLHKMIGKLYDKELKKRIKLYTDTVIKLKVVYKYKDEKFFTEETYTNQTIINGLTKDFLYKKLDKVSDSMTDLEDDYFMSLDFYQGKELDEKAKSILEKKEKRANVANDTFWEWRNKIYYYNSVHKTIFPPKEYISTLKITPLIKEMEEIEYYPFTIDSNSTTIAVLHPVFWSVSDSIYRYIPSSTKRKSHFYVIEVTLKATNNKNRSVILIPKKTNIYFKTIVITGTPSF
jgi:hypothetical protein